MSDRILYIDKLKGFAILFVVVGHVADFGLGIKDTLFNSFYISFHMPLFMFISGLFAFNHCNKIDIYWLKNYLLKRSRRLLRPFLLIGIIYSLIAKGNIYGHLLGDPGKLWFLPALFYITLAGIMWMLLIYKYKDCQGMTSYVAEIVSFFFVLGLMVFLYLEYRNIPYLLHAIKMFPFFMGGVFCSRHNILNEHIKSNNSIYTVSFVFYIIFLFLQYNRTISDIFIYTGFFGIIVLTQLFYKHENGKHNWLSILGTYSLEIYLFHYLFLPSFTCLEGILCIRELCSNNFLFTLIISLAISCPVILSCILLSMMLSHSILLKKIIFG